MALQRCAFRNSRLADLRQRRWREASAALREATQQTSTISNRPQILLKVKTVRSGTCSTLRRVLSAQKLESLAKVRLKSRLTTPHQHQGRLGPNFATIETVAWGHKNANKCSTVGASASLIVIKFLTLSLVGPFHQLSKLANKREATKTRQCRSRACRSWPRIS